MLVVRFQRLNSFQFYSDFDGDLMKGKEPMRRVQLQKKKKKCKLTH